MSCDFYFRKWKETMKSLENIVLIDLEYQETKAHDKTLCDAVLRLCGILGKYLACYNDAVECLQQNLQVQKTRYLDEVIRAIVQRIFELKRQIRKCERSNIAFLSTGLKCHKLTPNDAELTEVVPKIVRQEQFQKAYELAFIKARERKEELKLVEENEKEEVVSKPAHNWWDDENVSSDTNVLIEDKIEESEETIKTRQYAALIQTHERSRQVILRKTIHTQKRELWVKELEGTLKPPARLELRERAAKIIQKVCRAYFEIKRKRCEDCRRDAILGFRLCEKFDKQIIDQADQIKKDRVETRRIYKKQWIVAKEKLQLDFIHRKRDEICEDYRDFIRFWFRRWFDEIAYFPDIPIERDGGLTSIIKDDVPEPRQWWEHYQIYLEQKKANKNKSPYELKKAKKEAMIEKKQQSLQKRNEEKLMIKLLKNPTTHPGYFYPESKNTKPILEALNRYKRDWQELDFFETMDAKKKYNVEIEINNIYSEAKMDLMMMVNDDMKAELKILKEALQKDYATNGEKYPEPIKKPSERKKEQKTVKEKSSADVAEQLENLAYTGVLKDYPRTKLTDFVGDHNYTGDDLRCNFKPALPCCGETRALWWDRCVELEKGARKMLVVGPPKSGKSMLVYAMATINDAALFILDPVDLSMESNIPKIVHSVLVCARAVQPSVVFIKHIHQLFYRKGPPVEATMNADVIRRALARELMKKLHKTDNITIIGSCTEPWLTKGQLLKQFPDVVLMPDTNYSAVKQLLEHWIEEHPTIPRTLHTSSLAFMLRGYSYGHLKATLKEFLSPERIVKIAANGLCPQEIYDYILEDGGEDKINYQLYLNWYYDSTPTGVKEKKHIEQQREFKLALDFYAEKKEKTKKTASAVPSLQTIGSQSSRN